jgi:hypothetical protein
MESINKIRRLIHDINHLIATKINNISKIFKTNSFLTIQNLRFNLWSSLSYKMNTIRKNVNNMKIY